MQNIKRLSRLIIIFSLCTLCIVAPQTVIAQEASTIIATGSLGVEGAVYLSDLTLTFPPAGGPVNGNAKYQGGLIRVNAGGESTMACPGTVTYELSGTFTEGNGGSVSGTYTGKMYAQNNDCQIDFSYKGSWSGNFYANGSGSGSFSIESVDSSMEEMQQVVGRGGSWQVTFSAGEFATGLAPFITSEYIYNTYGIRVEDSFGDDQWAKTSWSDQELSLLNDVLKEVPPDLLKTMAVTRIVRNKVYIDQDGNPKPNTFGVYSPCDRTVDKDCNGSSATIRIFDKALQPFDFTDDPNGYKEFKGTIIHELTHALQYHKEQGSIYKNPTSSPLVQNYNDATRPVTDMNQPGFWVNNGWGVTRTGSWKLVSAEDNQAPTAYAGKTPTEDMSESVMLYMYEPQKLQNASTKRYNFIRDQIFGGVEYENGIRK